MFRRVILPIIGIVLGIGLAFWWLSYWPAGVSDTHTSVDDLWKTITKKDGKWIRDNRPPETNSFLSYQQGYFVLYGQGHQPSIESNGQVIRLKFSDGKWIFRSLGEYQEVVFESGGVTGTLRGIGGEYIDVAQKTFANFDADITLLDKKLLPSFIQKNGTQEFFDISEQKELIPSDLWIVYTSFFSLDKKKILGDITRHSIDTLILKFLDSEPKSSQIGIFRRDMHVRNALEETQNFVGKIESGDNCGMDRVSCFTFLEDLLRQEKQKFPDIFIPIEQAVHAWFQLNLDLRNSGVTWIDIFRIYHAQLIAGDGRARAVRDKSILDMIRSGNTLSSTEIWDYLTKMLASQKLGSAYSLQIVREMIRISDSLYRSDDVPEETKKSLANSTITSLSNLKNILENTYFTRKEYWFVLRDDLVDNEGNSIKNQTFINELQELIQQVDNSIIIQQVDANTGENLRVLRAQLVWFNCIFSRNEEYVNNPRICRITKTEVKT